MTDQISDQSVIKTVGCIPGTDAAAAGKLLTTYGSIQQISNLHHPRMFEPLTRPAASVAAAGSGGGGGPTVKFTAASTNKLIAFFQTASTPPGVVAATPNANTSAASAAAAKRQPFFGF